MTYVQAEALRGPGGQLLLRYGLRGAIGDVKLPELSHSGRQDDLWRHTCFEAFVRADAAEGYCEINLSPSTEWAAYAFDSYRQGMKPADVTLAIEVERTADTLELKATLDLEAALPPAVIWHVGLSAVVETGEGVSYWALAHAPGRADFHHPDCFALELPATDRS